MDTFGLQGFTAIEAVRVEVYTEAHRVSGTIHTPFRRVAEILNQLPLAHLAIEEPTIVDHARPDEPLPVVPGAVAHVALGEILVFVAPDLVGAPRAEMRIRKQEAPAMLALPPLLLTGTIHVPVDSRPAENLLNVADRFVPMTDVQLTSALHPALDRHVPVLAVRRDRAHVMVVGDESGDGVSAATDAARSGAG